MTDNEHGDGLSVSSAIESLRVELEDAWRQGWGKQVQFGVEEVSLTLTLVASTKKSIGGKVRWWVVEAGADGGKDRSDTQTMVLKLKPVVVDPVSGQQWSMQVSGAQEEPGE